MMHLSTREAPAERTTNGKASKDQEIEQRNRAIPPHVAHEPVCMRYVYLNPVRAGMVKHASDYAWSWIATSDGTSAGPVPDERLMRRVAQIGAGKIFGSLPFVTATAFALGDRFRSRSVAAREVGELGYATHGWRLAKVA